MINEGQLRRQRTRAGLHVGDGRHVDRYVAWLLHVRHAPAPAPPNETVMGPDLAEAAQGAAALASRREPKNGSGSNLTQKQESLIAALLTEPAHVAAAAKMGISEATLYFTDA
jgi:hypothetical protein